MTTTLTTTTLAPVRNQLRSVARRRTRARLLHALLGCVWVVLFGAALFYVVDRRLALSPASRLFLDVVWLGVFVWTALRRLRPVWLHREDEIDGALRIQRQLGIDSDVVAALQFDAARDDEESPFGSAALARRVVDDVADEPPAIDVRREVREATPRGWKTNAASLVSLGLILLAASYPRDAEVLLRRILLSSVHYPSATQITALTVDGRTVRLRADTADAATELVVPLGRPIVFELTTAGRAPESAAVELVGPTGGAASLDLAAVEGSRTQFRAVLPAVIEDVEGRAVAGDAHTETFKLRAAPLPSITVTLEVRPPAYAAEALLDVPPPGRLFAAVLEGSDVEVRVDGANKPLERVVLTVAEKERPLTPFDDEETWRLKPAGSDFAAVAKPIEFAIDVVDADGFRLPTPLRGSIALRPDQPPSVAADVITKFVLPTGKPSIFYQAADDLGVESLVVERQVQRIDGTASADTVTIPLAPDVARTAPAGKFPLELASLELHKGDKVTIRLTARDRRGNDPRAMAQSEPFVLEVTDEQGLYEAMAETDQRSALKMDEIIQKQLMMTAPGSARQLPIVPRPTATAAPAPAATPSSTKP